MLHDVGELRIVRNARQRDADGNALASGRPGDVLHRREILKLGVIAVVADGQRADPGAPERTDVASSRARVPAPEPVRGDCRVDAEALTLAKQSQHDRHPDHRLATGQSNPSHACRRGLADQLEQIVLARLLAHVRTTLDAAVTTRHVAAPRQHERDFAAAVDDAHPGASSVARLEHVLDGVDHPIEPCPGEIPGGDGFEKRAKPMDRLAGVRPPREIGVR